MAKQPVFEMLRKKRLAEQRVVTQVNHPGGKVIAGAPVGVDFAKFFRGNAGGLRFTILCRYHWNHALLQLGTALIPEYDNHA